MEMTIALGILTGIILWYLFEYENYDDYLM